MSEKNIPKAPSDNTFYGWSNKKWVEKDIGWPIQPPPSPYPFWVWNEKTAHWEPPVPKPENPRNKDNWVEKEYQWNEKTQDWELVSTKPFSSWIKTNKGWKAPIELSDKIKKVPHHWDENKQQWISD